MEMSNLLLNVFFIILNVIVGLRANRFDDFESQGLDEYSDLDLLELLKITANGRRKYRELGDFQKWPRRMSDRPSDPSSTIFDRSVSELPNSGFNSGNSNEWMNRWIPEKSSDLNPPLKFFQNSATEHQGSESNFDDNEWPGRWMPDRPSDPTPPPKIYHRIEHKEHNLEMDSLGRIPMGVKSSYCDDGKTNLTVDWDNSPVNYTCYGHKITPEYRINPHVYCEHIPPGYVAMHRCMQDTIDYDDDIPLYGTHRPIWPVYGEYKFVPRQRWLHNLEHGAIVMLYHPCANPLEVKRLKKLVTDCIRRHVITPSNLLDIERPLVLLSWGCRLSMSYVDPEIVQDFIMKKSLKGPEAIEKDGGYKEGLLRTAEIVSDLKDSVLCPNLNVKTSQGDIEGRSM